MNYPQIIQGGMGMGVSHWRLARAVSRQGQLGVVSGTALDTILVRRLQLGDLSGEMRRAMTHFPEPDIIERVLKMFFFPGGKPPNVPFKLAGMFSNPPSRINLELCVVANFVEVFLAKEGHDGLVGINLMEKILMPNLPSLYGAMLAGVDVVLMGAGIPREIPDALDRLARHEEAALRLPVVGAGAEDEFHVRFTPRSILSPSLPPLKRPQFLAIIASTVLGMSLARKTPGVNGFVIEGPLAGGHNAPPRGDLHLNPRGEPVYGLRDEVDLEKIRALGLPFWLAGAYASPVKLQEARACGAQGIQVGTAFAFCEESGFAPEIKKAVLERVTQGDVDVYTDPIASPTGFPFKVVRIPGSLTDEKLYQERVRICDLGYLRTAYKREDGSLGYRCPAEPQDLYVKKGGHLEETQGRICLCNSLQAAIDVPQSNTKGEAESPLITSGDDLKNIGRFLKPGQSSYTAQDVVDHLLSLSVAPSIK